ncbi:MAG: hypothetical protein ACTSRK_07975 [Promethearchaeota archaeon]
MKIPGSFYEAVLILNDGLIEFQIKKQGTVEYRANVMDFSEVDFDLKDILEENQIFIPKNRFEMVLEELEALYLELQQEQQKLQEINLQRQKSYTKSYQKMNVPMESVKILLLGGSGKSSIYNMIFENKVASEILNMAPTRQVEKHQINYASVSKTNRGQELEVWESGSFFPEDDFFQNGAMMIFIVDAFDVETYEQTRAQLHQAIAKMGELGHRPEFLPRNQPNLFCFIHKMDRFQKITEKYNSLTKYFRENPETGESERNLVFFPTSIFDSSIYRSWTKIVESLMPKSSKLNQLSNQLKDDLGLYTALIVEKRTGLPICSSKTLLDDATLVGTTNRILILIDKVLPDYTLTPMQELRIDTSTGFLKVKLFQKYYLMVLICPPNVDLDSPTSKKKISDFIDAMKNFI